SAMRTFIAIDLSEEARKTLSELQCELKESEADVKWVKAENMHLTLKFLGEISEEQAAKVKAALDIIASTVKPYEITIKEIGAFPGLDHPRVVWTGIEKGKKETTDLANKIELELEKLGFEKEGRAFKAHLTIGRVRGPKNKDKLKTAVQSAGRIKETPSKIKTINLYQSTLTPRGPIYTCLHKSPLE
ncbi:MAG: RNA 2',3'-cyclic phosphodiesterase, partial [Candidatus Omnitrophota bacterium]